MKVSAGPPLAALFEVTRDGARPLHRQLFDGLRRAIVDGQLRGGRRVPATRALAAELGVSRLTVLTAYDQLRHEGYLEARAGSGTFVCAALPDDALRPDTPHAPGTRGAAPPRPRRPAPAARPHDARAAAEEGGLRPFRVSLPALDAFPHALWARLVARQARGLRPAHMAYGDPAGLGMLRAAVAEHLRAARGVRCDAAQVLITSGSQAALRLCAAVLLAPGDRVAVEEPGYPGARTALAAGGAVLAPVPVDAEGLDVAALDAFGGRVRAAYVTPSHQYPLGTAMSAARRLALLDWARRRGAWVVEDDYDSEYRYVSRPLGALQGLDAARDAARGAPGADERRGGAGAIGGRVVYVGTFSKVLFPALRVGYLVAPPSLWDALVAARQALDLFPPTLYQLALTDFLNEGHFARHLRRMRGVYLERRDALLDGLARHGGGALTVHNADAGLHVTTFLTPRTPRGGPQDGDVGGDLDGDLDGDVAVVRRLHTRGLAASPLSPCYLGPAGRHGLLLGFGGARPAALARATRVLGEVLRA